MLHIKSKDTSIEVKLRKALWCRDIDIRRIIMSFRANQILQLPSILNNIINKSVLSALVMYTFCTKNVQNGTAKLIFLTKKTCQKSSNLIDYE